MAATRCSHVWGDHELLELHWFAACAPLLRRLKCGTGNRSSNSGARRSPYIAASSKAASSRAVTIDTPTAALAPRRLLSAVPSKRHQRGVDLRQARPAVPALQFGELAPHRRHGTGHPGTAIPSRVVITRLHRLGGAGRGGGRRSGRMTTLMAPRAAKWHVHAACRNADREVDWIDVDAEPGSEAAADCKGDLSPVPGPPHLCHHGTHQ